MESGGSSLRPTPGSFDTKLFGRFIETVYEVRLLVTTLKSTVNVLYKGKTLQIDEVLNVYFYV